MTLWHAARRLASSSSAAMRPLKVGVVAPAPWARILGCDSARLKHGVEFPGREPTGGSPKNCPSRAGRAIFELEGPTIVREASELGDDLDWVLVGLKSRKEQENVLRDLLEPRVAQTRGSSS